MLFNNIQNMLTEAQLQVLGFLAYTGLGMTNKHCSSLCRVLNIDEMQVKQILRELTFNKLVDYNGSVNDINLFPILIWVVDHYPDWISVYRKIDTPCQQRDVCKEGMKFIIALQNNEPTFLRRELSFGSESMLHALCPLISNGLFQEELRHMPFYTFATFMNILNKWLLVNDINESNSLLRIWDQKEDYKVRAEEEWAMTLLLAFYSTGNIDPSYTIPNTWHGDVINGTKYLTEGKYEEARKSFVKSLEKQKLPYFEDYISNYLYALSLAFDSNGDNRMKMYNIANTALSRMDMSSLPLKVFSSYFKDSKHNIDDMSLRTFCDNAKAQHSRGLLCMAYILSSAMRRNFGLDSVKNYTPNLWVLRTECSAFNQSSNDSLISRVFSKGSTSSVSISQIRHIESPQPNEVFCHGEKNNMSVPLTSTKLSSDNGVKHSNTTAQRKPEPGRAPNTNTLVYLMRANNILYPFIRTTDEIKKTESFKSIDIHDYAKGKVGNNISEVDRQIWRLWTTSGHSFPIQRVLPMLVNTGKLYTLIDVNFN